VTSGPAATRSREAGGFTLLEVLIAFAIASIALGVLYQGAAGGLFGSRLAARTDEAVARARSRLAAQCHGAHLTAGEHSGDDGSGYRWRTEIGKVSSETIERGGAFVRGPGHRELARHRPAAPRHAGEPLPVDRRGGPAVIKGEVPPSRMAIPYGPAPRAILTWRPDHLEPHRVPGRMARI
jgi:prepilin-type N-terminal cleavage/methylation domain-containing protein